MNVRIKYCDFPKGSIQPVTSKSISNRALIIHALTGYKCELMNLSESEDTLTLVNLLEKLNQENSKIELNVGAAGTVMRFLVTYCCIAKKHVVLTGTERMLERPVGNLVDALRSLGAKINYLEKEGYPPLEIMPSNITGGKINLDSSISSQFISSLLLCAPCFENGIEITLEGKTVSTSYIDLTIDVMKKFGVSVIKTGNVLTVKNQEYKAQKFSIEGDWSSASYFYSLASLSQQAEIELRGMNLDSLQGDKAILEIAQNFGVETIKTSQGILLRKVSGKIATEFAYDFNLCPDIVQTVVPMVAGNNVNHARLTGLETLSIKETDRIMALKNEMFKFGIEIDSNQTNCIEFSAQNFKAYQGNISTYEDHRMAMGFAPLVQKSGELIIENKDTVKKSYMRYWEDLNSLGCIVENYDI